MMRHINIFRAVLLVVAFVMLLFASWLVNSESGLRWAVERVHPYLPGEVQLDDVGGKLSGPLRIGSLHYRLDELQVKLVDVLVDWTPSALFFGQLKFNEVSAQRLEVILPEAETQTETPLTLPRISSPFNIEIAQLDLNNITVQPHQQDAIEILTLGLNASLHHDKLRLSQLELVIPGGQLGVSGSAELDKHYPHELEFRWDYTDVEYGKAAGQGKLKGDLSQTLLTHRQQAPLSASATFTLYELLEQPSWHGKLDIKPFAVQKLAPELPSATVAAEIKIQGDTQAQQISGTISSDSDMLGEINGQYQLTLADESLSIKQLHLQSPDNSRSADLRGQWQLGNRGSGSELVLTWHGLSWPLQGSAEVSSANGTAYYKGPPDDFRLSVAADLDSPHWHASHLRGSGGGNLQGLNLDIAQLLTLDGELYGPVKLGWADAFSWQAALQGKQLNPAQQWPEWPGSLNLIVTSQGSIKEAVAASLDIKQFGGTLRQYPVKLKGRLAWREETLTLNNVEFHSADSRVHADGRLGEQLALDWRVNSNNLLELYPDIHGSLDTAGSLTGNRDKPLLQFSLSGEQLAWQEHRIGKIRTNARLDLFNWQQLQLDSDAETLTLFGQSLDALQIKLTGKQRQRLFLNARHALAALQLQAEGILSEQAWQGSLNQIQIDSEQLGRWQQQTASRLNISAEHLSLEPLCLINADARVCVTVERQQQQWQGELEGKDILLDLFSPWLADNIRPHGKADINLQASYQPEQPPMAKGQLILHPGDLDFLVLDDEWNTWAYQHGQVDIHLDKQGLRASAHLDMNTQDYLDFNAELVGFNPFEFNTDTQKIDSSIEMSFSQINLFQNLLDEAHDLKGKLKLRAHAQGLLASPTVQGKFSLSEGSINIPRLGLEITNIDLKANAKEKLLSYQMNASSGTGDIVAEGETQLKPKLGWPTQITIQGNEFQVSNFPEARITISPEINLSIQHHRVDVEGTVYVPYARLQPKDISSAKLPSDDTVIHSDETIPEQKWQIYSSIRLILGDRVSIYGFGFEGRIAGNVLLIDEPGKPPIGIGELTVPEGRYRAYGQRLDVEHGSLLFASSPLNNPGLNLRAVRKVQDVTAGITVSGTLRKPEFNMFSVPAMGETDTLAYLVLGRPLDKKSDSDNDMIANAALALGLAGGDLFARRLGDEFGIDEMRVETSDTGDQASLIMGRYLTPKLYISYGIGLIESVNTLRLRYQVTNKWQLEAESGAELGADVLYTIER